MVIFWLVHHQRGLPWTSLPSLSLSKFLPLPSSYQGYEFYFPFYPFLVEILRVLNIASSKLICNNWKPIQLLGCSSCSIPSVFQRRLGITWWYVGKIPFQTLGCILGKSRVRGQEVSWIMVGVDRVPLVPLV